MHETKQTLYELRIGVLFFCLIFLLGNIFSSNWIAYTLGLVIGGVIAYVMSSSMYHALEEAMLYDKETAAKKVQRGAMLRYIFMLAGLVAAILLPEYISVVGVVLGILSLKFAAFLQPLTHKVLQNFINKGR